MLKTFIRFANLRILQLKILFRCVSAESTFDYTHVQINSKYSVAHRMIEGYLVTHFFLQKQVIYFISCNNIYNVIECAHKPSQIRMPYSRGTLFLVNTQLTHDIVTMLGFGCFLVATSDNVVTTLSQRCVSDVVTTTKN